MAASITTTQNPVVIPRGQQSTTITITWSTGDATRGKVSLSVNGGPETPFDDGGNASGSVRGSKTRAISLGETLLFRLRRAAAPNTVLASLTVTAQVGRSILDVVGAGHASEVLAGMFQFIYDLTVSPGLDYVDFSFRTTQPTVPLISLAIGAPNIPPGQAVTFAFPLFKGLQTTHNIRVGSPPRPEQDTLHFYKIEAAASIRGRAPAIISGIFTTGTQTADFIFERIVVHRDGDPNSKGDFLFTFGAGDAETKDELGMPWPTYSAEVGDGETAWVNRTITIPRAPRRLWAGVIGTDDDGYIFAPLCTLGTRPSPYGPWTTHAEQEACEQSSVWAEFDTWNNGQFTAGVIDQPFAMPTGNFGVAFTVHGRLRVSAVAGAAFKMVTPRGLTSQVGIVLEPGRLASVSAGGDRTDIVTLGPDGAVYHKAASAALPSLPRDAWTSLGGQFTGPLTALASGRDRVSIFALGEDGAVFHKTYADGDSPDGEWENLGAKSAAPLAVAASAKGQIELFALGRDGTVYHRSLTPQVPEQPREKWVRVGDGIAGSLAARYSPAAGLSLFALARDGSVVHKLRAGDGWRPQGGEWESLGGEFKGLLSAAPRDDGAMVVAVFTEDRSVYVNVWEGYPECSPPAKWERAGSIDSLFEALIARVEPEPLPARMATAAGQSL